jgi:hypothetical protein
MQLFQSNARGICRVKPERPPGDRRVPPAAVLATPLHINYKRFLLSPLFTCTCFAFLCRLLFLCRPVFTRAAVRRCR